MIRRPSLRLGGPPQRLAPALVNHPLTSVLVIALIARVAVALVSYVVNDGVLIPDEGQYIELARTVVHGGTPDQWAPAYGQTLYDATRAFMAPLIVLFHVFGSSRLTGQLFSAVVGAGVAGLTTAIGLRFLRPGFAALAGLVVALTPSQVLFSSVVLREAHVWLALALVGLGAVVLASTERRKIAVGIGLAAAGLLALAYLREQTLFAADCALAITMLFTPRPQWLLRVASVLAIVAVVPWIAGFGPGGWQIASKAAPQLAETRAKLAVGANSAIVKPTPAVAPAPASPAASAPQPTPDSSDTVSANVSRLPQGLLDVAVRPYPWEATSGTALLLARVENLWWFVLYVLAAIGVGVSARRRPARLALLFPVLSTGMLVGMSALTQGNLGTAFRHRDQLLWALALCGAAGVQWLFTDSRFAVRRHTPASTGTTEPSRQPAPAVAG